MSKVIGIPSNGPELSDEISEHFGHCLYFVGIKLNEDNTYEKTFSLPNNGHSSCMEPVINMKNRAVTDMIVGGIGGRPFMGFIEMGINLYQGNQGKTLEQNIELLVEGKLKALGGPSCGGDQNHHHTN